MRAQPVMTAEQVIRLLAAALLWGFARRRGEEPEQTSARALHLARLLMATEQKQQKAGSR